MKLLISALTLGFAVAAASQAQAHVCADGTHRSHCVYHKHVVHHYHHHFHYVEAAPPPPPPGVVYYPGYRYYYPPTPATLFDVPPEYRLPANQLQWLMNQTGDRPYAQDTPY